MRARILRAGRVGIERVECLAGSAALRFLLDVDRIAAPSLRSLRVDGVVVLDRHDVFLSPDCVTFPARVEIPATVRTALNSDQPRLDEAHLREPLSRRV